MGGEGDRERGSGAAGRLNRREGMKKGGLQSGSPPFERGGRGACPGGRVTRRVIVHLEGQPFFSRERIL